MARSLFDVADEPEKYSEREIVEIIAEAGVSMALDNGSDMLDVDAREHAESEWAGYIGHAVEALMWELQEIHGDDVADMDWHTLFHKALFEAPGMWEQHNYTLQPFEIEKYEINRFE